MRRRVDGVIDAANRHGCKEMWREDSPIWAHPLYRDRLYRPIEYPQVTGHTPVTEIMRRENLISCDVFSTDRQGHRNACTLIRRPEIHTYKRYGCLEFGVQKKEKQ